MTPTYKHKDGSILTPHPGAPVGPYRAVQLPSGIAILGANNVNALVFATSVITLHDAAIIAASWNK